MPWGFVKKAKNELDSTAYLCHFDQDSQHPASAVASSAKWGGIPNSWTGEDNICRNCSVNFNVVLKCKKVFPNRELEQMVSAFLDVHCPTTGPTELHLVWVSILVSYACSNKLTQTGWLKIRQMYSLPVPEARNPKTRCWHGHALSKDSRESALPCLFKLLVAPGVLWFIAPLLQYLPPSSHGLSPTCLRISVFTRHPPHVAVFSSSKDIVILD